MKKNISLFLSVCFVNLMTVASVFATEAGVTEVTTPDEFYAALEDDTVESVLVTADMELTQSMITLTKDVTIAADVVYHPSPDDDFFVKSLTIPEGVTLTVTGKISTESTFDTGFTIAQIYIDGGSLDVSEGSVNDDCNINFDSGSIAAPADGFNESVSVAKYLDQDVTEESIKEALEMDGLRTVNVQMDCEINSEIVVPEGKELLSSTFITVNDGAGIKGTAIADSGFGYIITGGYVNDVTAGEGTSGCIIVGDDEGTVNYDIVDIKSWQDASGEIENCALIVTVEDFMDSDYAVVKDSSGSVNLYNLQMEGETIGINDAGIESGDVLVLLNPVCNKNEGSFELNQAVLAYTYKVE